MADSSTGGVVLKADDGTAYFIRDEILEACKLEGEYLENAKPVLEEGDVEGFALNARETQFTSVANYASNPGLPAMKPRPGGGGIDLGKVSHESTIMCPW